MRCQRQRISHGSRLLALSEFAQPILRQASSERFRLLTSWPTRLKVTTGLGRNAIGDFGDRAAGSDHPAINHLAAPLWRKSQSPICWAIPVMHFNAGSKLGIDPKLANANYPRFGTTVPFASARRSRVITCPWPTAVTMLLASHCKNNGSQQPNSRRLIIDNR